MGHGFCEAAGCCLARLTQAQNIIYGPSAAASSQSCPFVQKETASLETYRFQNKVQTSVYIKENRNHLPSLVLLDKLPERLVHLQRRLVQKRMALKGARRQDAFR
jgi:hypothetical protein